MILIFNRKRPKVILPQSDTEGLTAKNAKYNAKERKGNIKKSIIRFKFFAIYLNFCFLKLCVTLFKNYFAVNLAFFAVRPSV